MKCRPKLINMRVETEFKERSTQLSFRARRRPQMRPTFRIGGRGISQELWHLVAAAPCLQLVILSEVAAIFPSAVLWPRGDEVEESLCGFG